MTNNIDRDPSMPGPVARPDRRWLRITLRTVQFLLATMVIVLLARSQLDYNQRTGPLFQQSTLGEVAEGHDLRVKVSRDYFLARTLIVDQAPVAGQESLSTSGVWLVVPTEIEALRVREPFGALLRSRDGHLYAPDTNRPGRTSTSLAGRFGAPGLIERGAFFFELPPDQLANSRLFVYTQFDLGAAITSVLEFDLEIDDERARSLTSNILPAHVVTR